MSIFRIGEKRAKKGTSGKKSMKLVGWAEGIVLILIPFMSVTKEYALIPVSLIFVFGLMMIKRIVVWRTSLPICKRCGEEVTELTKENKESD